MHLEFLRDHAGRELEFLEEVGRGGCYRQDLTLYTTDGNSYWLRAHQHEAIIEVATLVALYRPQFKHMVDDILE